MVLNAISFPHRHQKNRMHRVLVKIYDFQRPMRLQIEIYISF